MVCVLTSFICHLNDGYAGKTSVSVALSHIFGFGHTQSDDVHAKKSAPAFLKNVVKLLQSHDIVIADK